MDRFNSIRILIIEDNPADIRLVQEMLAEAGSRERIGYELFKASDLKQASELLAANVYDVVLLDLSLPDSTGLETVKRILPLAGNSAVVVMSGLENQTTALDAVQAGAQDYLVKGYVDPYSLPRAIHYAIERVKANKTLAESERKFRDLAELSRDAIVLGDEDGLIIEWNQAAERLFGLAESFVIGRPLWEVQFRVAIEEHRTPTRLDEIKTFLLDFFKTGINPQPSHMFETPIQRPDGSRRIVQSVVYPIKTEQGFRLGSISRDITEQRQTENLIHLQSAALEAAANAIVITDCQGLITWANPAFTQLTGYNLEEALGKKPGELLSSGQHNRAFYTRLWATILAGEVWQGEMVNRTKSGRIYQEEMTITPVRNPAGEISHFVAIKQDITSRDQARQEILRQAARSEALMRTASRLNAQHDLETVLLAVCEETIRALPMEAACVSLATYMGRLSSPAMSAGLLFEANPDEIWSLMEQDLGLYEPGTVQIFQPDSSDQKRFEAIGINGGKMPSWIARTALTRGSRQIGFLAAVSFEDHGMPLSKEDQTLLRGLADEAAQAITNAHLLEDARQRAAQLEMLYESGLSINSVISSRAQKQMLFEHSMRTLSATRAAYFEYDPTSMLLSLDMAFGMEQAEIDRLSELVVPLGDERGLVGLVAKERKAIYLPDAQTDQRFMKIVPSSRSVLWAPVERGQELLGVVSVSSPEVDAFTDADKQLLQLYANQAAVALENTQLFEETQRKISQLEALHTIDEAISGSFDLNLVLDIVLAQITIQLSVDSADILLLNSATQTMRYAAGRGFKTSALQHTDLRYGTGIAGQAAFERRTILVQDLSENLSQFRYAPLLPRENFVSYIAVPLIAKGQVKGVLEVFQRSRLTPEQDWLKYLNTLATQTAIAIDNASLYNDLQHSNMELILAYDHTLEGWSRALELRDVETEGHSRRVTDMTLRLAQDLGLRETEMVQIRRGSLLHDIGKMAIPDSILLKNGPLDAAEWALMRQHPVYAYQLLEPIAFLRSTLDIPLYHHEKWDGSGYPNKLSGEQIPLSARIFAVVDVWDALSSNRPYRLAWSKEKVRSYLEEQSGVHFDPRILKAFLNLLDTDSF